MMQFLEGLHKLPTTSQAFVLLGTSSIRRPRRRLLNVVTKDKILFFCSIEFRQAGTNAEQRTGRSNTVFVSPNSTNAIVVRSLYLISFRFCFFNHVIHSEKNCVGCSTQGKCPASLITISVEEEIFFTILSA